MLTSNVVFPFILSKNFRNHLLPSFVTKLGSLRANASVGPVSHIMMII